MIPLSRVECRVIVTFLHISEYWVKKKSNSYLSVEISKIKRKDRNKQKKNGEKNRRNKRGFPKGFPRRLKVKQDDVKGGSPCLSVAMAPEPLRRRCSYLLDLVRGNARHARTNERNSLLIL